MENSATAMSNGSESAYRMGTAEGCILQWWKVSYALNLHLVSRRSIMLTTEPLRHHDAPLREYLIPHYHAKPGTKEMYTSIPVSVRLPLNAKPGQKFPVVMTIYGLDGYRTEHT